MCVYETRNCDYKWKPKLQKKKSYPIYITKFNKYVLNKLKFVRF